MDNYVTKLVYTNTERFLYKAIDAYIEVKNPEEWLDCPNCKLKPLIWEFNNGSSTACGCGKSIYDHFSIYAESIMSWIKRHDGSVLSYDNKALQKNWNHWVLTGEENFLHAGLRTDGRW
jgi:hypothetical protein